MLRVRWNGDEWPVGAVRTRFAMLLTVLWLVHVSTYKQVAVFGTVCSVGDDASQDSFHWYECPGVYDEGIPSFLSFFFFSREAVFTDCYHYYVILLVQSAVVSLERKVGQHASGVDDWIVRNTWGPNWGMGGVRGGTAGSGVLRTIYPFAPLSLWCRSIFNSLTVLYACMSFRVLSTVFLPCILNCLCPCTLNKHLLCGLVVVVAGAGRRSCPDVTFSWWVPWRPDHRHASRGCCWSLLRIHVI